MKSLIIDDEFIGRLEAVVLNMKIPMNGFFGGSHKTHAYGSTIEFADFREYVMGDDIRRIDWNLFSRFEKYYIKLFVDERQMHNQIFLDCSSSMASVNPNKSIFAMKIAAALGYLSVNCMDKTSYKLMQGDISKDLGGSIVGKEAYYSTMALFENVEFKGTVDINKAITSSLNVGHNDGMTIIISDFLTENDWKKSIDFLLFHHRQVMLVQVLSPDEIDPTYNGRIALMDSEMENPTDFRNMKMKVNRATIEAYRAALKDYIKDIKTFCASRGIDFLTLSCNETVEKVIFKRLQELEVVK